MAQDVLKISIDKEVPVPVKTREEQIEELKGVIEAYKVQNPAKYEWKKAELEAKLAKLVGKKPATPQAAVAPTPVAPENKDTGEPATDAGTVGEADALAETETKTKAKTKNTAKGKK